MRKLVSARGAVWLAFIFLLAVSTLAAQHSILSNDNKDKAPIESKQRADFKDERISMIASHAASAYQQDPDAAAKKLVESKCGSCHGLDVVSSAQKTKEEWAGVVQEMISYGADLKESETALLVDYLAKNYGPKK